MVSGVLSNTFFHTGMSVPPFRSILLKTLSSTLSIKTGYVHHTNEHGVTMNQHQLVLAWRHISIKMSHFTDISIVSSKLVQINNKRQHPSSVLLAFCEGNPLANGYFFTKWYLIWNDFPWHDLVMMIKTTIVYSLLAPRPADLYYW